MPVLPRLSDSLVGYETLLGWAGALSFVMLVGSLGLIAFFVTRTPADYFAQKDAPPSPWADAHPVAFLAIRVVRNVLGAVLIVAGVAMLVLPGQGLLTILMGLMLLEFPGKRRLEFVLVRRPQILDGLNWIRGKANREPFEVFGGD